ncbi:TorD/DmsD family molecular chaperone [Algicella marina]|uniref:Molecular chaperone TorD n=1 Tax=Algicella marina TaxID=2683284 RepID=A0A6P1T0L9_9RHOB|nr:molecular chaperone TorD family protein [Algicella marina]QHQ35281.1 molecular chaperone TorD [Algicella marina]
MNERALEPEIAEEECLRADLYDFLGALLAAPPDGRLLSRCEGLAGDDTAIGKAFGTLARVSTKFKPRTAEREFNALFIGLGRGELLPYASFYLTGFLNERPLAVLRRDMARLGIERADNVFEPEDNIASLCEMMAGLIRGRFGDVADLETQKSFFNVHIGPWARHFFNDLESAKNSVFYAPVGAIGAAFMDIEKEAFRMTQGAKA